MKSNPLISIIVPIYNVEKFLPICVESLLNQIYTNLEIILVDDGSTDNSPEICDNFALKDSRIKVIHKENGGMSDARNAGIEIATGDYIGFVDSDDYIEKEMYQTMLAEALENDAQIVECDSYAVYKDDKTEVYKSFDYKLYTNNRDIIYGYIREGTIQTVVWNKLYTRDIIGDIRFEFGKYHEDEIFTYQVLAKTTRLVHINKLYYYYVQRKGSVMNSGFSLKYLDAIEGGLKRAEFIKDNFPEVYFEQKKALTFFCIYNYQRILDNISCDKDKAGRKKIVMYRKQLVWDKESLKKLTLTERFYVRLSAVSMALCARLKNLTGSGDFKEARYECK